MSEMIPETKNNTSRNILIVVGVVAALCLCVSIAGYVGWTNYVKPKVQSFGTQAGQAFKTDPAEMAQVADHIADFDMPPGYELEGAMSLLGYEAVFISPADLSNGYTQIMLVQTPNSGNVSEEQLRAQAEAMSKQSSQGGTTTVVETRNETIRGQDVVITVTETTTGQSTMRQWTAFFKGKNGLAILMIQGQANQWDEQLFLNFIHSIR